MSLFWKCMYYYLYFALNSIIIIIQTLSCLNIIFMASHLNWFESPLPKPSNYNNVPIFTELDHEELEKNIQPFSNVKNSNSHPLSPWSIFLNENTGNRENNLTIPGLMPIQSQKEQSHEKLIFSDNQDEDEEEEEDLVTPVRQERTSKDDNSQGQLHTTGKKSQAEAAGSNRKSRPRQKGLRKLSHRAYEIVKEMRNVTYKEVAAKLVQELNDDEFESENKEQQNIKRRVYDALNVLIALGVLRKEGRKIVSDKIDRQGKSKQTTQRQVQFLKRKIAMKTQLLTIKKNQMREAEQRLQQIAYFIGRNKSSLQPKSQKIFFPFVGTVCNIQDAEKSVLNLDNYFTVRSNEVLQPFGDIDCLSFIKNQDNPKQIFQF